MRSRAARLAVIIVSTSGCDAFDALSKSDDPPPLAAPVIDAGVVVDAGLAADSGAPSSGAFDRDRAMRRFATTSDIMRGIIAPTCAAENNECHANEEFPDMSSETNLWNLAALPCNQAIGERSHVEGFCEVQGDQIRIEDGDNAGFIARIGSIVPTVDELSMFNGYEMRVDGAPAYSQGSATFVLLRRGEVLRGLGGGGSLFVIAGSARLRITRELDIPSPHLVKQGDENQDGIYGDGRGVIVRPGDARGSYMIRRLSGRGTDRLRMPLNYNSDNPTEINTYLTTEQMFVLMSWINCMRPDDEAYSPVRYDCPENESNDGTW